MFIDERDNLADDDDYAENLDPTTEVAEPPADWPTDLTGATTEWLHDPLKWAERTRLWHDEQVDEYDVCPLPGDCIYGCVEDDEDD